MSPIESNKSIINRRDFRKLFVFNPQAVDRRGKFMFVFFSGIRFGRFALAVYSDKRPRNLVHFSRYQRSENFTNMIYGPFWFRVSEYPMSSKQLTGQVFHSIDNFCIYFFDFFLRSTFHQSKQKAFTTAIFLLTLEATPRPTRSNTG